MRQKIGFLTTWNQRCGLATFARFLIDEYPEGEVIIFGETSKPRNEKSDEAWVKRCWSQKEPNALESLEREIRESGISILHINCHARFFKYPQFSTLLSAIRKSGIKVLSHVHSIFTLDASQEALFKSSDLIVTHSEATRLEVIAHGIDPRIVRVVPHGVEISESTDKKLVREKLGLPHDKKVILTCGFMQPHKGMEAVIDSVWSLKERGIPAYGIIVGSVMPEDPGSVPYSEALVRYAKDKGVSEEILFVTDYVTDTYLLSYMRAADLIVLNYKSTYYESSGIGALAVGSGTPVITSLAPAFNSFGNAVFRTTAGFDAGLASVLVIGNQKLREDIRLNAKAYSLECSWSQIAKQIHKFYSELMKEVSAKAVNEKPKGNPMRVLMQNRGNMFSHPGGDTTLVEKLSTGLKKKGIEVVIDTVGNADPAQFDLVHLFNFALPDMIRPLGQKAVQAGKPFVVSTLAEDIPQFHLQSHAAAATLIEYQSQAYNKKFWSEHAFDWNQATPCAKFDNEWVARNASALLSNGAVESNTLEKDYPGIKNTLEVKLGHETIPPQSPEMFVKEHGVSDFIFCVGRIETRKNQLMLLKALEDSDLPIVFATGGFSYQQDYDQAVRSFKRKGKTLFLGRLSPEMLASAYAASKIHVLPSWYELPGLVTLEAAAAGKNVVATRYGTMTDYLGDLAFYCHPGDADSMRNAVLAAYYSPVSPELVAAARSFSWETTIAQTIAAYEKVTGSRVAEGHMNRPVYVQPVYDMSGSAAEFQESLEKGELAAKNIDFENAHKHLAKAEAINPESARALKARGATYLAEGNVNAARPYFEKAYKLAPNDEKVISGRGMCEIVAKDFEKAIPYFQQALRVNQEHSVSLYQLVDCFLELNRVREAEFALREYLMKKPQDVEAKALYAKALFEQGKRVEAADEAKRVLEMKPDQQTAKAVLQKCVNALAPSPTPKGANKWDLRHDEETKALEVEDFKRRKEFDKAREYLANFRKGGFLSPGMKARLDTIEGELLALEDNFSGSEEIFDRVLVDMPEFPRALCGKGALAAESHRWNEARMLFERALRAESEHDVALAGLAICELAENNGDQAWTYFQRALKKNPENQRAVLGIVQLGYPRKDYSAIEGAIKTFLDYHPVSIDMQYALAGVLYAQKRSTEAKVELEKILIFEPGNERALELKSMIEKQGAGTQAAVPVV